MMVLGAAVGVTVDGAAYDPPCPPLEHVVASRRVVFVARVVEAREVSRGDGTDARAAIEVECCLVGGCNRPVVEVVYRARGGVDERDMGVPLAPGKRYLFALGSSLAEPGLWLETYAAKDLVFEFETLPEYRVDRRTPIRAVLPWGFCKTEVVTFDDLISAALRNREHGEAPLCPGHPGAPKPESPREQELKPTNPR